MKRDVGGRGRKRTGDGGEEKRKETKENVARAHDFGFWPCTREGLISNWMCIDTEERSTE